MRISREGHLVTLINVFETNPEQQQALIDAWLRFVESAKEEPGLSSLARRFPSVRSRLLLSAEAVYCLSGKRRWRGSIGILPRSLTHRADGEMTRKRSKDRMTKSYRVTAFVHINNTVMSSLLRSGITVWSFSLLTVRGRKSGRPIVTPLAVFVQEQQRYLIATYGIVNWVRNLRAAGGEATLTRGRHSERIRAIELEPVAAAPIVREALRSGPPGVPAVFFRVYRSLMVLPYLGVTEHASLEEFEREVLTHPVFLVQPAL